MIKGSRAVSGVVIVALALVPLGCQTASQHPTKTGAATGGAIGAGAGALIDKDKPWRGALIGAAAGALLGAGVGHVIKRQREAYQRIEDLEVKDETVSVPQSNEPNAPTKDYPALMLRMQSDVLFKAGSSTLSEAGAAKIKEIAQVMREYPDSDALIRGFTSSEGSDQVNFELSQRRAQVVMNELVADGVSASRLTAQGMGSSHPIASNDSESGRAMNRRVEIHVIPHEQQQ